MISSLPHCKLLVRHGCRWRWISSYVQGQIPSPKTREYFYFIDHQGMLFLDDSRMKNFTSCIKEQKFLRFFFRQLRFNDTDRYPEFPYLSPCGRERNYVRCDDLPVVFTHLLPPGDDPDNLQLSYCHTGALLSRPFEPRWLCMLPETGRVYHPGPERLGGVGLVKSSLAIEFGRGLRFAEEDAGSEEHAMPTHFSWLGETYQLTNDLVPTLQRLRARCQIQNNSDDVT